jgi:maltokinase
VTQSTQPATDALLAHLKDWLPRQRWFAAKGRVISRLSVAQSVRLREPEGAHEPGAELLVLVVEFHDGGREQYQLLVGRRAELPTELEHVVIGRDGDWVYYDAAWDAELTGQLLDAVAAGTSVDWLRFVPEPGAEIPTGLPSRVMSAEQSNTSIVYGDELILKLFRRLAPGINPDLELHRALRELGSGEVAALRGAIEGTLGGEPAAFGLLQDFAPNSADGWSMALISLRDLFAEADLRADEVGGDFAGEAFRLGKTVGVLHRELAQALGTTTLPAATVSAGMLARLEAALPVVPELEEMAGPLRAAFDGVAALTEPIAAQRIHGDLHLGQALRTPRGWLMLDLEGEPARPLAERRDPDVTLKDVAGMLRSFDYAAYHQLSEWGETAYSSDETEPTSQLVWHAEEWTTRNRGSFCDGYTEDADGDPREHRVLLHALELDKAVYEAVYEKRNRPSWLPVPLRSLRRLLVGPAR